MPLGKNELGSNTVIELSILESGLVVTGKAIVLEFCLVRIFMAVRAKIMIQSNFRRGLLMAGRTLHSGVRSDKWE